MARKYKRLRYEDRKVIEKMSRAGSRVVDIAATLGVHRDNSEYVIVWGYMEFNQRGQRKPD